MKKIITEFKNSGWLEVIFAIAIAIFIMLIPLILGVEIYRKW